MQQKSPLKKTILYTHEDDFSATERILQKTFRRQQEPPPPTPNEPKKWKRWLRERFRKISDQELINTFHSGVSIRAFNRMRGIYLKNLRKEIIIRNFDLEILFERYEKGAVTAFILSQKVMLENRKLVPLEDSTP